MSNCHHMHDFEKEKKQMIITLQYLSIENIEQKEKIIQQRKMQIVLKNRIKLLQDKPRRSERNESLKRKRLLVNKILELTGPVFTKTQVEKPVYKKKLI